MPRSSNVRACIHFHVSREKHGHVLTTGLLWNRTHALSFEERRFKFVGPYINFGRKYSCVGARSAKHHSSHAHSATHFSWLLVCSGERAGGHRGSSFKNTTAHYCSECEHSPPPPPVTPLPWLASPPPSAPLIFPASRGNQVSTAKTESLSAI